MTGNLERISEGKARYNPGIYLERLRKATRSVRIIGVPAEIGIKNV
jgi:hypothetical protein